MAMMLNMRGTCNRAGKQSMDQPNNDTDLDSQAPPAQIAADALKSISSFLITIGAHQALISPSLCLAILTSRPAWAILETSGDFLLPDQEGHHSSICDIKTIPQPLTSNSQKNLFRAAMAISMTAFLTCLIDQIFRQTASFPSALMKKWDAVLPTADFMTLNFENFLALPLFLQALSSVHFVQANPPQPRHFLSIYTQAVSIVSPPGPLTEASGDPACGPNDSLAGALDQLSVLSHILSSGIWEVLIDYLLMDERSARLAAFPMTLSLYQAVAIAEETLSSSSSNVRRNRGVVMDASTEQRWQDCRAGIEKALLILYPLTNNAGAASTCQRSSVQTASLSSASGSVSWSSALPLLRFSLLQLREVLKTSCNKPFVPRDWELIKAELLLDEAEEVWGVSSCCNTSCSRFEGPCEVEVKTLTCGGMCGARYCSRACQELAWRAGHRRICGALKEMRVLAKQRKPVQALNVRRRSLSAPMIVQQVRVDTSYTHICSFNHLSDKSCHDPIIMYSCDNSLFIYP